MPTRSSAGSARPGTSARTIGVRSTLPTPGTLTGGIAGTWTAGSWIGSPGSVMTCRSLTPPCAPALCRSTRSSGPANEVAARSVAPPSRGGSPAPVSDDDTVLQEVEPRLAVTGSIGWPRTVPRTALASQLKVVAAYADAGTSAAATPTTASKTSRATHRARFVRPTR